METGTGTPPPRDPLLWRRSGRGKTNGWSPVLPELKRVFLPAKGVVVNEAAMGVVYDAVE